MKIRKNDNVLVVAGKDKGKRGIIRYAYPVKNRVLVEGVNMIKRHTRARGTTSQAGIVTREAPISVSNVTLLCTKCNNPTRVGFRFLEKGDKVRVCKKCHEVID